MLPRTLNLDQLASESLSVQKWGRGGSPARLGCTQTASHASAAAKYLCCLELGGFGFRVQGFGCGVSGSGSLGLGCFKDWDIFGLGVPAKPTSFKGAKSVRQSIDESPGQCVSEVSWP